MILWNEFKIKRRSLHDKIVRYGVYLLNGTEIVEDAGNVQTPLTKEEAAKNTMAYGILKEHNTSSDMEETSDQI